MPGWSNISLFLQIALVVAGVLLFSIFDPFGLLNTKKQTLEDTPISVQSIREIGKFISAEYYGEVLSSLQEAIVHEVEESVTDDAKEIQGLREQFQEAILDLRDRRKTLKLGVFNRGKKLTDIFYHDYAILTQHPYYQPFISMLTNNEAKLIKKLFNEKDETVEDELKSLFEKVNMATFQAKKDEQLNILTADKKFRKSQIVVLGRGWVKAGIDFKSFNQHNFRYDKENKTIHLVGIKPEILYCTINPWFIPEKEIKGFEVVVITKKARKPEYMQKVKHRSLEKLRQNALRAGILEQAKANAEENLKNFFSILIPEGIDQVVIHDSFFTYFDASFVSDSLSATVMQSIDSLFIDRYQSDSAAVISLRDSIKSKNIYLRGKPYRVNRFSSRLAMAEDEILSEGEVGWINEEKKRLDSILFGLENNVQLSEISPLPDRLDSIWFYPNQTFANKYWKQVNDTSSAKFSRIQIISEHADYLKDKQTRTNAVARKVFIHITKKKINALEELSMILRSNVSQIVKGDTTFIERKGIQSSPWSEERKFEHVESIDLQLSIIDSGSIHSWENLSVDTVSFEKLDAATKVMVVNWGIDNNCVKELKESIVKKWRLLFDATLTISRYSGIYHYVSSGTLNSDGVRAIYKEKKAIELSDSLINQVDIKEQDFIQLHNANDTIDKVWYYPSEELIGTYKRAADKRSYGFLISAKKKKQLKILYQEFQIQRYIHKKRKEDFERVVSNINLE